MSVSKSKKRFLLLVAGISVLLIAAIFATPRSSWVDTKMLVGQLFHKYEGYPPPPPPPYRDDSVSPKPSVPVAAQGGAEPTTNQPTQENDDISGTTMDPTLPKRQGVFPGPALYRNEEFGFELSIPKGWRVAEDQYGSPFSYFNMTFQLVDEEGHHVDAIDINIAKHGFAEMSYRGLKPDDNPIVVDGVQGLRYEYDFEGGVHIDYVLNRPKDTFLIGGWKNYEDIFDEIVSSLRFFEMDNEK
jgi:hypothetical protein